MDLEYPRENDPFATADADKIAEYRVWAHRALDKLLDYRLSCEEQGRGMNQPYHSVHADYAGTDDAANDLYVTTLMFANKLIGRRALAFNAEMFDEGSAQDMRAALQKVVRKMSIIWPARPVSPSNFYQRRAIQSRDLINGLIDLDQGYLTTLCIKGDRRPSDIIKERCRFAGVLWSIHLKERGVKNHTSQIVSAFELGVNGKSTVQRWKRELLNPSEYAKKLGYNDAIYINSFVARAKLVNTKLNIEGFGEYILYNVFGEYKPSRPTLKGVGAFYRGADDEEQ